MDMFGSLPKNLVDSVREKLQQEVKDKISPDSMVPGLPGFRGGLKDLGPTTLNEEDEPEEKKKKVDPKDKKSTEKDSDVEDKEPEKIEPKRAIEPLKTKSTSKNMKSTGKKEPVDVSPNMKDIM